ncbi:MAG: prepilin-type N-terminal cleavage/methylation domain-containing protein [Candidatus Komeilibacteria bacterium]|nr:prepilin-type N-terminal cleavage/methylation domain-containing protein [Candidatus Komeilibacteria bacterium]
MKFEFVKDRQGFTLIEILISLSIFSLLVFAVSTIYIAFNNSQMRTTASQQLLNDSQYAFELMAREIRTSSIVYYLPDQTWCESVLNAVGESNVFTNCIVLEKANGQIVALTSFRSGLSAYLWTELRYVTLNNCVDAYKNCDSWHTNPLAGTILLSPTLNDINIDSLDFHITPTSDPFLSGGPNQQPKVTINMTTSYYDDNKFKNVKHTFQTTVSSRVYKR